MLVGKFHHGPASNFPPKETWKEFDELFRINRPIMKETGDTDRDIEFIRNAIEHASRVGVEKRVILCIIMQESTGNVGVRTPDDQHTPGLMQCLESPGFPGRHNLPQEDITAMIVAGTNHYKRDLRSNDDSDTAKAIYEALRLYNSGRVNKHNLSDPLGATASYVSDVANRLQGKTH